jgi:dihydroorotase
LLANFKASNASNHIIEVATSGNPKFFLGTDSAPHAQNAKENACGCAGCYSAPNAIELYAQAFDQVGKLERLKVLPVCSVLTSMAYRAILQQSLVKEENTVAESFDYLEDQKIIPLHAGKTFNGEKCDTRRKQSSCYWSAFSWILTCCC